jgi:hypothetical protein
MPNEQAFPSSVCSLDVTKVNDMRKIMRYIDHSHQDFWNLSWETTSIEVHDV